jgi:sugar lactone lactonase YvrE
MCSDSKPVGKLCGPRGILRQGTLLVSNQNANLDINGEIDRFNPVNGTSLGAIVPPEAAAAPSAPDGIIISPDGRTLYVADQVGSVERFDRDTGQFLGSLDFSALLPPGAFPRGLVFGPGGVLYISVWSLADQTLGWVLRYNVGTGTVTVVASTATCGELHRPDGLAFGPDGRLYVTSFRKHRLIADDIDRILIVTIGSNGAGRCSDQIDLDQLDNRAFAQYVLFGPGGDLFVPIVTTGEVRRYDVTTKSYTDFVAPGGPLLAGWGLTFGRTNPATLAYGS